MDATRIESTREAQLTKRVPHALFHLMPFPPSAPRPLLDFERHVLAALTPSNSRAERITALSQVLEQLQKPQTHIPDAQGVLAEFLACPDIESLHSPLVNEAVILSHLRRRGLSVTQYEATILGPSGLPWIVKEKVGWQVELPKLADYLPVLGALAEAVFSIHDATSTELEAFLPEELRAAFFCLQLHSLYGTPSNVRAEDVDQHRLEEFEGDGVGLWLRLLELVQVAPASKESAELLDSFGERALRRTLLRLRGKARSASLGTEESDEVPELTPVVMERTNHEHSPAPTAPRPVLTIVGDEIPPANSSEDRATLQQYAILRQPLPLALLPTAERIEEIAERLGREFPWANEAVSSLCDDLLVRRLYGAIELGSRPTLLVGLPGCGKSRLVRRISEELSVPFLPLAMGGMNDSMAILGTARGWAGGQASPIVGLLARRRTPTALVLLDEVDKVMGHTKNSVSPTVALLNLLEPEGAVRWYDTFLQTTCDLSRLMFWATANTLGPIPKPLLSRFRVVMVPEPKEEHFDAIAKCVCGDLAASWGLPRGTLPPVSLTHSAVRPRNVREVQLAVERLLVRWAATNCRPGFKH